MRNGSEGPSRRAKEKRPRPPYPDAPEVVTCGCSAPAEGRTYSTLTGHATDCPEHRRIVEGYDPGPAPMEDRGTSYWVWVHGATARFEPFAEAAMVVEVSVPIGWELRPDVGCGVALVNVYGERRTASEAWGLAAAGAGGFKVRATVQLTGSTS